MPRIRCNYEGCIHLEGKLCTARRDRARSGTGLSHVQPGRRREKSPALKKRLKRSKKTKWEEDEDEEDEEEDLEDWEEDEDEDEDDDDDDDDEEDETGWPSSKRAAAKADRAAHYRSVACVCYAKRTGVPSEPGFFRV